LFAELVPDQTRVLGRDDPDTLDSRVRHAYNVWMAGDCNKAAQFFAELLPDITRVLGKDHSYGQLIAELTGRSPS
ncbi:hypothetical protein ACFV04_33655, partial [Kitasatospora sp. NPDC059599]